MHTPEKPPPPPADAIGLVKHLNGKYSGKLDVVDLIGESARTLAAFKLGQRSVVDTLLKLYKVEV